MGAVAGASAGLRSCDRPTLRAAPSSSIVDTVDISMFPAVHALAQPVATMVPRPLDAPRFLRAAPDGTSAPAPNRAIDAVEAVVRAPPPPSSPPPPARPLQPAFDSSPPSVPSLGHFASIHASNPQGPAPLAQANQSRILFCEGYLSKIRGLGQTRKRFFRFTSESLTYYTEEAGEAISSMIAPHVEYFSDSGKCRMRVTTKRPFGKSDMLETVLETPSEAVKLRWMEAFRCFELLRMHGSAPTPREGALVAEGYLTKVKPMGYYSQERWFVLTARRLAYFEAEGGDLMASLPLSEISDIVFRGDSREFVLRARTAFTKSGLSEIVCCGDSLAVRNRWMAALKTVLDPAVFKLER